MERTLAPVAEIFRLNTELLLNCIADVSEVHAAERVLPGTNSIAFVVAHVADARHFVAAFLGRAVPNPLAASLGDVTRIEEVERLPGLAELREYWVSVSKHVEDCLETVSVGRLESLSPQKFPVQNASVLGGLAFLAQHESYHVGQLSFIRKGLGYPAMIYTRSSSVEE